MSIDWNDGTDNDYWDDPAHPWHPLPGVRTGSELTKGERAADLVRNKMGSWGFVSVFLFFMLVWAGINSFALKNWFDNKPFDPYPYILLNLLLSTLAGLQGAILLIAAKRADAVAAEQALSHLTISKTSSELIRDVHNEIKKSNETNNLIHQLVSEVNELIKTEKEKK